MRRCFVILFVEKLYHKNAYLRWIIRISHKFDAVLFFQDSDLMALEPGIVSLRRRGRNVFAYLIFSSAAACDKVI